MLRFFRTLRRKLLEEDNMRKYIWYAIGEVFLVVIGILIALQINNWNEGRKEKAFEQSILKQFEVTLSNEIEDYNRLYYYLDRKKEALIYIYENQSNIDQIPDSVFTDSALSFGFQVTLSRDPGVYETLKGAGINKISNDSLRTKITRYYEILYPRQSNWLASMNDDEFINDISDELLELNKIQLTAELNDGEFEFSPYYNWEELLADRQFMKLIQYEARREFSSRLLVNEMIEYTEELLSVIRIHIED